MFDGADSAAALPAVATRRPGAVDPTVRKDPALHVRSSVRHWDQPIARAHVLVQQTQKCLRDRSGFAFTNNLGVPLDDRRHFDRAAQEQHLASAARLRRRDVADFDTVEQALIA